MADSKAFKASLLEKQAAGLIPVTEKEAKMEVCVVWMCPHAPFWGVGGSLFFGMSEKGSSRRNAQVISLLRLDPPPPRRTS